MVSQGLASIDAETSGGPSGLDGRTMHALRHSKPMIDFMTLICQQISTNSLPLKHLFTGSRLIPLKKTNNGIRPLAVGDILYRTGMKIITRAAEAKLLPWRLGINAKGGVEPILHYLQHVGKKETLFAIDLRNAFNSLKREFIYTAVCSRAPQLLATYLWAYRDPSCLYTQGGPTLSSTSGVRQGDPVGPLLFSLGFSIILEKLHDRLRTLGVSTAMPVMAYLDDTIIAVEPCFAEQTQDIIDNTFQEFRDASGLVLRPEKTKTLTPSTYDSIGLEVLGGYIGTQVDNFVRKKLGDWNTALGRLSALQHHDNYLLLRQCIIPQLTHLLRVCNPSVSVWKEGDAMLAKHLQNYLSAVTSQNWDPRLQSLPTRLGGLGLSVPSMVAPHAWAASCSTSQQELLKILPDCAWLRQPVDTRSQKERLYETWRNTRETLLADLTPDERCSLLDTSSSLGSRWLRCLPISPRLTFADHEFAAGLAARLLLRPGVCRNCKKSDPGPNHHDTCAMDPKLKIRRHDAVKYRLAETLEACGSAVIIEPSATKGNRRADITAEGPAAGGRVAFDVSIVGLLPSQAQLRAESSNISEGQDQPTRDPRQHGTRVIRQLLDGSVARKRQEARTLFFGAKFQPFVLTTGGTLHPEALDYIKRIRHEDPRLADQWMYEVSAALMKYRAAAYLGAYLHDGPRSDPATRA